MAVTGDHEIFIAAEEDGVRIAWECSCGRGGSVPEGGYADVAAEKHVGVGESVVWVSRPRW